MWSMRANSSSRSSPAPLPASIRMSSSRRNAVVWQRAAIEPEQPSTRIMQSTLHELHLRPCQLDHVAVAQVHGIIANRGTVHRWASAAFHMCKDIATRTLGDRSDLHARLTNCGHHFGQRDLAPGSRTVENFDRGRGLTGQTTKAAAGTQTTCLGVAKTGMRRRTQWRSHCYGATCR